MEHAEDNPDEQDLKKDNIINKDVHVKILDQEEVHVVEAREKENMRGSVQDLMRSTEIDDVDEDISNNYNNNNNNLDDDRTNGIIKQDVGEKKNKNENKGSIVDECKESQQTRGSVSEHVDNDKIYFAGGEDNILVHEDDLDNICYKDAEDMLDDCQVTCNTWCSAGAVSCQNVAERIQGRIDGSQTQQHEEEHEQKEEEQEQEEEEQHELRLVNSIM